MLFRSIVVGSDFNVNPMCWILSHKIGNGDTATLDVFDELVIRNTNTEKTLELLAKRYGQHRAGWLFCGDATGRSRKTSASESDYVQIRNDDRFVDRRVSYPKSNPSVVNRFAACNALLKNAAGVRRCRINPKCKRLIDDLTDRAWKEGTREPDDYADMGHASDAFGYIVTRLFPIRVDVSGETPEIFGG